MKFSSIKTQLAVFLAVGVVTLSVREQSFRFLGFATMAVGFAVVFEACARYIKERRLGISESAFVSGLIIGYVLSSDVPWFVVAVAAGTAIASKYLIRPRGRHIFNPAAFGLCFVVLCMQAPTQWRGTYLWYIIVPLGFYVAYRIRKMELVAGYALAAFILFGAQSYAGHIPFVSVFGYLSYFFIFVMMIEPKTTPVTAPGKFLFGMGVAFLIFVFTEAGIKFDAELASLLGMNMLVPLLNKVVLKNGGLA